MKEEACEFPLFLSRVGPEPLQELSVEFHPECCRPLYIVSFHRSRCSKVVLPDEQTAPSFEMQEPCVRGSQIVYPRTGNDVRAHEGTPLLVVIQIESCSPWRCSNFDIPKSFRDKQTHLSGCL